MKRIRRSLCVLAACGVASVALVAAAQASSNDAILICHGTASDSEPYVLISVDEHALAGHFDGTEPGHGDNNHPDVYPNADGSCGGGEVEGGGE